jgi:hypothetical protein
MNNLDQRQLDAGDLKSLRTLSISSRNEETVVGKMLPLPSEYREEDLDFIK